MAVSLTISILYFAFNGSNPWMLAVSIFNILGEIDESFTDEHPRLETFEGSALQGVVLVWAAVLIAVAPASLSVATAALKNPSE